MISIKLTKIYLIRQNIHVKIIKNRVRQKAMFSPLIPYEFFRNIKHDIPKQHKA
jgi:hypothetical protein